MSFWGLRQRLLRYIDSGETCDDGNTVSGDGCSSSSTCQAEACYWCSGAGPTSCSKTWENGAYNSGSPNGYSYHEVCDEGAGSDDLGWLNCCTTIQTGYKCSYGQECWLRWGDGVLDSSSDSWGNAGEKWDDGNRVSGDGWRADWGLIEADYEWPTAGSPWRKIWGNGIQNNPFSQTSTQGTHYSEDCFILSFTNYYNYKNSKYF